jgi:serpin B
VIPGGTQFALDLYRRIAAEHEGENLFISPFSVRSALAMTWEGTRGQTAEEMAGVLRLPDIDRVLVHAGFGSMARALNAQDKPYEFNVANALWLEQAWPFEEAYLQQITKVYGAALNQADFITQHEKARAAINGWVEDQTNEKIKKLMPEGTITDMTRLVLANAVYFKGQWKDKFDPGQTRDGDFTLTNGTVVQVPMMRKTSTAIRQGNSDDLMVIELPYVGDALTMVILQPYPRKTLADLEARLTPERLATALENMQERTLSHFQMPKFRITTDSYRLNDALISMGMETAFTDRADFTGLSPMGDQLLISDVMHKGFVDVNEEGTEAAAATGVSVMAAFSVTRAIDRPFLFLIRHRPTGEVLFLGRVLDPREP